MRFKIYLVKILLWLMVLITKDKTANEGEREFFRISFLKYLLYFVISSIPGTTSLPFTSLLSILCSHHSAS